MDDGLTSVVRDDEADTAEKELHFRFRAFVTVFAIVAASVAVGLLSDKGFVCTSASAAAHLAFAIGIPWLAWHLRFPFAARVLAPVLQLSGLALEGRDPRDSLWTLADLPVLYFLFGWMVDLCLRPRRGMRSVVGRLLFSAFWIYFVKTSFPSFDGGIPGWLAAMSFLVGVAIVWIPTEKFAMLKPGTSPTVESIVISGLRTGGVWIASRVGIVVLILFPTLIYLDLLELPPRLQSETKESASLIWTREIQALQDSDFSELEVYATAPDATKVVVDAIRTLRLDPRNSSSLDVLRGLQEFRISTLALLETFRGTLPIFYVEILPGETARATAGMFSVPESRWSSWDELRPLSDAEVVRHTRGVHRATVMVLVNGILILLLLGGTSGGSATAWSLAIFLAGTSLGWAGESLEFLVERTRYVLWRDYSDTKAGATLFGLHSLLLFFSQAAEWLIRHQVVQAGLWVSLCWPPAPGRLIRSTLDRFWLQAAKISVMSVFLYGLTLAFFYLSGAEKGWVVAWFLFYPILLVGSGFLVRRNLSGRSRLPAIGLLAATAFVFRGWVPLLSMWDSNWPLPDDLGRWVTVSAVLLAIVVAIMWTLALERGTFLSPPHVQGQLWLIGIAALPFIESVVGDPVFSLLEESGLFLGTAVGWLAFGAAVWLIGPVFSFLGEQLSRWRAKGLRRFEELHQEIREEMAPGSREAWVDPFERCFYVLSQLDVLEPEIWRHCGSGKFSKISSEIAETECEKLMSSALASRLAEVDGSLRLEEMRGEWKWAAFSPELERFFLTKGDLLLIPASHEGRLVGLFWARDAPRNRFLLRPAVSEALARLLATAIVFQMIPEFRPRRPQTVAPAV